MDLDPRGCGGNSLARYHGGYKRRDDTCLSALPILEDLEHFGAGERCGKRKELECCGEGSHIRMPAAPR